MIQTALAAAVIVYGVAGAFSSLLQLRRMRKRRSSQDVCLAYLFVVSGGYVFWLVYGLAIRNVPLIVVDAVGGVAIFATICVAIRLRHSWLTCLQAVRATRRRRSRVWTPSGRSSSSAYPYRPDLVLAHRGRVATSRSLPRRIRPKRMTRPLASTPP